MGLRRSLGRNHGLAFLAPKTGTLLRPSSLDFPRDGWPLVMIVGQAWPMCLFASRAKKASVLGPGLKGGRGKYRLCGCRCILSLRVIHCLQS